MVINNDQPQIQNLLNKISGKPKLGSRLMGVAASAVSGNPLGAGMALMQGANAIGGFFHDWRKEQEQRQLQQLMAMRNR